MARPIYLPMLSTHMWAHGKSRIPPRWSRPIQGQQDLGLGQYETPPAIWAGLKHIDAVTGGSSCCGGRPGGMGALPEIVSNPWLQAAVAGIVAFAGLKFIFDRV